MRHSLSLACVLIASPTFASNLLEGHDIIAGKTLYVAECAACHGAALEGAPDWQTQNSDGTMPAPPHDETGHTWHHSSAFLFAYTKEGGAFVLERLGVEGVQSAMPAFGDLLTDDEIWNILSYIHSTWPEQVQEIQAARSAP